jgi:hypothetical protein
MKNKIAVIAILTALIAITIAHSGCKTIHTSKEHTSTYKESYRDTNITVPGESVKSGLDSAQLAQIYKFLKAGKGPYIQRSHSGGTELKFSLDTFGNMIVECEKKDQTIAALVKMIQESNTTKENKEIEVIKYRMPWWGWPLIVVFFALFILKTARII